jgi:chromosome segregation ATPase
MPKSLIASPRSNCARKFIACFLFARIFTNSSIAHAECIVEGADAAPLPECVVMKRGTQRGVWFSLKSASVLEQNTQKLPELKKQVTELEAETTGYVKQIELYKGAVKETVAVNSSLTAENEALQHQVIEAQSSRDAWYRSPWLWFGAGVATTVATAFAITQAAK